MTQYRRRAEIVDAVQWNRMGDHAAIRSYTTAEIDCKDSECGLPLAVHGYCLVLDQVVCPGSGIVTRKDGKLRIVKRAEFEAEYVKVTEHKRIFKNWFPSRNCQLCGIYEVGVLGHAWCLLCVLHNLAIGLWEKGKT